MIEREEFCASKFTFTVFRNGISFGEGDAVSVKYDGETMFFGYIFSRKQSKEGLIEVTAYDQMRYLKNRRTYTRGRMTLDEVVSKIAIQYRLRTGVIEKSAAQLQPVAADNVSLLDVIKKAAKDTEEKGGGRYMFYDDAGYLMLKKEAELETRVYIDSSLAEDYVLKDTIDEGVYNMIEVYSDTRRINLRSLATASDSETMKKWGTLILSKKAEDSDAMASEASYLLKKYNKLSREMVLKSAAGNTALRGGSCVYVSMDIGEVQLSGKMRVKKAVHRFENNAYTADIYLEV